jgi:hypothetical protein
MHLAAPTGPAQVFRAYVVSPGRGVFQQPARAPTTGPRPGCLVGDKFIKVKGEGRFTWRRRVPGVSSGDGK